MTGLKRDFYCGQIDLSILDQEVTVMGWVQHRRDHGGLVFIDLRDRTGLVQTVFNPQEDPQTHEKSHDVRAEYVLALRGRVRRRPPEMVNPKLPTGEVEIFIRELRVLNEAQTPPFIVEDHAEVNESVRLRYRYLDLRRPSVLKNFILRDKITQLTRSYLSDLGFLEVETPILTKSTPEGARDYLVPSRLNRGSFYALPQSPQLFKQLLMIAGFDRYYQIVKCFRDEDLRADRQPEFTQIDLETSFLDQDSILELLEGYIALIFKKILDIELKRPFLRIPFSEAMTSYGSDKPDLRYGLEIVELNNELAHSKAQVFQEALKRGGCARALRAPGAASKLSRKQLDDLVALAISLGAKGLAWLRATNEGFQGPLAKFLSEEENKAISKALGVEIGDVIFFGADQPEMVSHVLGQIRVKLAKDLNLIAPKAYSLAWITNFPMFERDPETKRWAAKHHPFTAPMESDLAFLESDPALVRAQAYDLVLNGNEIGGGSIRIHSRSIQERVFKVLGLKKEEAKEKFSFLLEALTYGAPPHGGCAFGLDRLTMILAGASSLREVIAFPKTQKAACPLTDAPNLVDDRQLLELGLKVEKEEG
jgi:aspartyl-tRNA synthetase